MNLGKFLLSIAGIVAFFKQNSSMRKIGVKIVLFYVLIFFVASSCVGTKINKNKVIITNVPSKTENLDSIKSSNIPTLFE